MRLSPADQQVLHHLFPYVLQSFTFRESALSVAMGDYLRNQELRQVFWFDPDGTTPNSYSSWKELVEVVQDVEAPLIVFPRSFTVPIGTWIFPRRTTWLSISPATGSVILTIGPDTFIANVGTITNGLVVNVTNPADGSWTYPAGPPGSPWVLIVGRGAVLLPNGGALVEVPSEQYLVVAIDQASYKATAPPTAAFAKTLAADSVVIGVAVMAGPFGGLPDGWVTGPGSVTYQLGLDASNRDNTALLPSTPGHSGSQQVYRSWLAVGLQRYLAFSGRNGAGACACSGLKTGDAVVGIVNLTDGATASSGFETTVTADNQIAQTSADDLSGKKFSVLVQSRS